MGLFYKLFIYYSERITEVDNTKVISSYGIYIFEINNQQLTK